MKTTKFKKLGILGLALAASGALGCSAQAAPPPKEKGPELVFVGTYTNKTESKGIYAFRFDARTGKISGLGVAGESADPSFVAVSADGKYLYAVNELGNYAGTT